MPKRIERKIEREYERKGYSKKRATRIAYATMNKRGLLHRKGKRGKSRGH